MTRFDATLLTVSMAVVLAAAVLSGCDKATELLKTESAPKKYVLVFVDGSSSVKPEDEALYLASFASLLKKFSIGDRIELGMISDQTLTSYSPLADEIALDTGVKFTDERTRRAAIEKLEKAFAGHPQGSKSTLILDALTVARQRFAADAGQGRDQQWLVILSDMLEQSEGLDLAKKPPTGQELEKFIGKRREAGRLQNLAGVEIFVGGATAPDSQLFESVERFWLAYFAASEAICPEKNYQRAPLRF